MILDYYKYILYFNYYIIIKFFLKIGGFSIDLSDKNEILKLNKKILNKDEIIDMLKNINEREEVYDDINDDIGIIERLKKDSELVLDEMESLINLEEEELLNDEFYSSCDSNSSQDDLDNVHEEKEYLENSNQLMISNFFKKLN